jgi:hypothetical protein
VSEPRWKVYERAIAKALGGLRLPNTGRRSPDIISPGWVAEVKVRRTLPQWLLRGLAQAEGAARETGLAPLLVLVVSQGRGRPPLRLAILRLDTLVTLTRAGGDGQ